MVNPPVETTEEPKVPFVRIISEHFMLVGINHNV